jgi:hypothetical protein
MTQSARRLAAVGLALVLPVLAGSASVADARSAIGPGQHFEGVVNGDTSGAVVYTACAGPSYPGRTGPVVGGQTLSVVRARDGAGNTGPFSQVYAWFVQDSSSNNPVTITFTSFGVKQRVPSAVRVPCDGPGQVQFSSCPDHAPCAAGFVPDIVDVTFVNIAD